MRFLIVTPEVDSYRNKQKGVVISKKKMQCRLYRTLIKDDREASYLSSFLEKELQQDVIYLNINKRSMQEECNNSLIFDYLRLYRPDYFVLSCYQREGVIENSVINEILDGIFSLNIISMEKVFLLGREIDRDSISCVNGDSRIFFEKMIAGESRERSLSEYPYRYKDPYIVNGCFYSFLTDGCSNQCGFCGDKKGSFSPVTHQFILGDLKDALSVYNGEMKLYFIFDRNIVSTEYSRNELITFAKEKIKEGIDVNWSFMGSVCFLMEFSDKDLEVMKESNLCFIECGFENGSQSFLDRIGKKLDVEESRKCIKRFSSFGIMFFASFISFDPFTSPEEVIDNLTLLKFLFEENLRLNNGKVGYQFPIRSLNKIRNKLYLPGEFDKYEIKDSYVRKFYDSILKITFPIFMLSMSHVCFEKYDESLSYSESYDFCVGLINRIIDMANSLFIEDNIIKFNNDYMICMIYVFEFCNQDGIRTSIEDTLTEEGRKRLVLDKTKSIFVY